MAKEEEKKPKKNSSSSKKKQKIPTVSEKVDNEDIISNKKKKKKSSTGSTGSTNERKSSKEKKSKRSKKKSSREEEDETKSEINLLSASANPSPKLIEDNNSEENEGSDLQVPAPSIVVEKPKKSTSKKKKSSRKSSVGSVKDQLADSHSSLRDYFPDTALKNYLQGLHDDVESLTGDEDYSPRFTPSPIVPQFPPSQLSGKVFLEKDGGFRSTTQRKLTSTLPGNQVEPDLLKPSKTPLDLSLDFQRIFRSIGVFCHGFLAGLAFWQLIMVFILSEGSMEIRTFVELYSPLSQPLHLIFYLLTVICTISILDRYDIAKFEWRQVQKLLTCKSGGFAIVIYAFTLIITLVTTRMDDKLSLYHHNTTMFDALKDEDLEDDITSWKALNMCRSLAVILGWLIVSLRPNTDLLYKNLKRLSAYEPTKVEHKLA